jgi:hypothetical protein
MTRGPSWQVKALRLMRWPRRWKASSSVPLFVRPSPLRRAARPAAAPEKGSLS